jgi:S-formylglutathione hydrolase FrmB
MTTSITTTPFIAFMWITAVGGFLLILFVRYRRRRIFLALVATVMVLMAAASSVNSYFDYIPTVGALLGHRARDEASFVDVHRALRVASLSGAALPKHGKVVMVRIPGVVSHFHARPAQLYLPPIWFARQRPRLPVIELLHGTPGTPEDWTRAALADVTADDWAAAHDGVAPIIVMPDINGHFTGDTECVDGSRGRAETYLTRDVVRWVIAHADAKRGRTGWAIAGASEGGYCAIDLALRHRDRFATFLDFSGLDRPTVSGGVLRLFGGSELQLQQHLPSVLLQAREPRPRLAGWFEVGGSDGATTRAVEAMAAQSRRAGIITHLSVIDSGHHTWRVWRRCFDDALPWTAVQLGIVKGASPSTAV